MKKARKMVVAMVVAMVGLLEHRMVVLLADSMAVPWEESSAAHLAASKVDKSVGKWASEKVERLVVAMADVRVASRVVQ